MDTLATLKNSLPKVYNCLEKVSKEKRVSMEKVFEVWKQMNHKPKVRKLPDFLLGKKTKKPKEPKAKVTVPRVKQPYGIAEFKEYQSKAKKLVDRVDILLKKELNQSAKFDLDGIRYRLRTITSPAQSYVYTLNKKYNEGKSTKNETFLHRLWAGKVYSDASRGKAVERFIESSTLSISDYERRINQFKRQDDGKKIRIEETEEEETEEETEEEVKKEVKEEDDTSPFTFDSDDVESDIKKIGSPYLSLDIDDPIATQSIDIASIPNKASTQQPEYASFDIDFD